MTAPWRDDAAILRACRRGDDRAARLLYARLSPALRRYARAILREESLADDAVQSAFCRLMATPMREVRRVRCPAAWMATLVRREALMTLRARRREADRAARRPTPTSREATGDSALRDAVDRLPRPLREVIVLRHVSGLSFQQIAEALGANPNTVAWRHRCAIDILRREFEPSQELSHA